jgi:hypothetical protein
MSIHVVSIPEVEVDLSGTPTVRIVLPSDYRTNYASDAKGRQALEDQKDDLWIEKQIKGILQSGKGYLATASNPMRSFGSGVLVRVPLPRAASERFLVLNIRGSNRGTVWPMGHRLPDMLCWKEFAGVTGSPEELLDPRLTAIKELYEEIAFLSDDEVLLPNDLDKYPDTKEQVEVGIARARRHYGFNLAGRTGSYPAVGVSDLKADPGTTVEISDGQRQTTFSAIVNYDPTTNALEISFLADIVLRKKVTGILSLAGPEHTNLAVRPYMEDVVVVSEGILRKAVPGQPVPAKHLLSVHGPTNYKSPETSLLFSPAATLLPLVWHLDGTYCFGKALEAAL